MDYPLINGLRYDFSSVEVKVEGVPFRGIKSLNFTHKLDPGKVRGNRAHIVGRTRGQYEASGDMEVYKGEWAELLALLASKGGGVAGFMEVPFQVVAYASEAGQTPVSATLNGCRITEVSHSGSEGNDPLVVKVNLDVLFIEENGQLAVNRMLFVAR